MAGDTARLRSAIIQFYREELRHRYDLANVRQFEPFEDVPDETIVALRAYFLEHVYPPPEDREQLDEAFNHLGRLLRSPKRMRPLVGTAFSSLWTLGRKLPGAISAGRATFDAYSETRKLEQYMLSEAIARDYHEGDIEDRYKMLHLISSIPEKHVRRLIKDIMNLFHSLTNIALLRTSCTIMTRCYEIMEERPDLYDACERDGLALGLALLNGGLELFAQMDRSLFPQIIEGIEQVEHDWYNRVRTQVAAQTG
ncbi:MAG: hypothetical protein ACLFTT_09815 [Candidatus Hydrogenedentota bacterium]